MARLRLNHVGKDLTKFFVKISVLSVIVLF